MAKKLSAKTKPTKVSDGAKALVRFIDVRAKRQQERAVAMKPAGRR